MRGYSTRGFHVKTILVDLQFKAIKDRNNLSVITNVCSRDEHIPEIERFIRVIKERARCYYAMLLRIGIDTLPKGMIMQLMQTVVPYQQFRVEKRSVANTPTGTYSGRPKDDLQETLSGHLRRVLIYVNV